MNEFSMFRSCLHSLALAYPAQPTYSFTMPSMSASFQATLDLFSTGLELMRQNLRRQHPQANEDAIDRRLHQWLLERPGAELGDSAGRPVDVDARRR